MNLAATLWPGGTSLATVRFSASIRSPAANPARATRTLSCAPTRITGPRALGMTFPPECMARPVGEPVRGLGALAELRGFPGPGACLLAQAVAKPRPVRDSHPAILD